MGDMNFPDPNTTTEYDGYEWDSEKWAKWGCLPNNAKYIASGVMATGDMVVLNADGTVSVVEGTITPGGITGPLGDASAFSPSHNLSNNTDIASTYDSKNNKIVVAYRLSSQGYNGIAVVGTINGSSITFGAPVEFSTSKIKRIAEITYSEASGNVVIFYSDIDNNSYGMSTVGTVSGTSISFGAPVVFLSEEVSLDSNSSCSATYNPKEDVCVFSFRDTGTTKINAIAGKVSGNTINFGPRIGPLEDAGAEHIDSVYDASADRIVNAYISGLNANRRGTLMLLKCAGTTLQKQGVGQTFSSKAASFIGLAYDSANQKTVVAFTDDLAKKGTACVLSVNATSVSVGSKHVFEPNGSSESVGAAYNASTGDIVITSTSSAKSDSGQIYLGTVSGSDISFSDPVAFNGSNTVNRIVVTYADAEEQTCISYADYSSPPNVLGKSILHGVEVVNPDIIDTNLTQDNYIGVSKGDYTDGTEATVQIRGINSDQQGMTVGEQYIQPDGSLDATAGDPSVLAGTAISPTELNIKESV